MENKEHSPLHKFTEPLLWWSPSRSSNSTLIFTDSYWCWDSKIGNDNTFWMILATFPFHLVVVIFMDIDQNITARFSKNGDVKGFLGILALYECIFMYRSEFRGYRHGCSQTPVSDLVCRHRRRHRHRKIIRGRHRHACPWNSGIDSI